MIVTPQSDIYLLSDIHIDRTHTIDFENETKQTEFFISKQLYFLTNCNFIRKENSIPVEIPYDELMNVNYLMYRNDGDKWYYCFITRKEYVSNDITKLFIETDVLQTYMFDYELMECYVERMHHDRAFINPGDPIQQTQRTYHHVKENLELGEKMELASEQLIKSVKPTVNMFEQPTLVVSREELFDGGGNHFCNFRLNGRGTPYYVYFAFKNTSSSGVIGNAKFKINTKYDGIQQRYENPVIVRLTSALDSGQYSLQGDMGNLAPINDQKIVAVIPIQRPMFTPILRTESIDGEQIYYYDLTHEPIVALQSNFTDENIKIINIHETKPEILGKISYNIPQFNVPSFRKTSHIQNNESKLFTEEFTKYQLLSDYSNIQELYPTKYSDMYEHNILYDVIPSINNKEFLRVDEYNEPNSVFIDSQDKSIPLATDYYQNYIQNNKASRVAGMAIPIASTAIGIGATFIPGGQIAGASMIASGVASVGGNIAGQLAKESDLKNRPDTIRKTEGDILLALKMNNFTYRFQILKPLSDYLKQAYDFLRVYGYKTKRFVKPNLKTRYFYNYIKTVGATITGNLDKEIIEELVQIYDKGLTFWHYRDEGNFVFKNYQYENIEMNLI